MVKIKYTQEQIKKLLKNSYVENCTDSYITFTAKCKYKAVKLWNSWLKCREIFTKLKFPKYIINSAIPTRSINRWKRILNEKWKNAFNEIKKWRKKGYKKINIDNMTQEELIEFLQIKIIYLEKANKVLEWVKKKIITKSDKFSIILTLSNKYNLYNLCYLAWVSMSWFYVYKNRVKNNLTQENKEKNDYEIIKKIVLIWKRRYWYRTLTMHLYRKWNKMNHKKVHRIMKKYNLLSKVRQKNPYKNILKATKEYSTTKNILNREFKWLEPFKKLWTDISYIKYNWKHLYLSIIKDMVSWEILSSYIWTNLWIEIVEKTINKLYDYKEKINIDFEWSIIHSDQWFHYTHPIFSWGIKQLWFTQSMSRRWNCIDNSPTESFFLTHERWN